MLIQKEADVSQGGALHPAAEGLVAAYHRLKQVEVVTNPSPLEPPLARLLELSSRHSGAARRSAASRHNPGHNVEVYSVDKVNTDGLMQARRLWLDMGTRASGEIAEAKRLNKTLPCMLFIEPTLYNFDRNLRLKKRLPLRHLVQVEKLRSDNHRLNLVFSSQGATQEEEENIGGLETTYTLQFSRESRRDEFVKALTTALGYVQTLESHLIDPNQRRSDSPSSVGDSTEDTKKATDSKPAHSKGAALANSSLWQKARTSTRELLLAAAAKKKAEDDQSTPSASPPADDTTESKYDNLFA